MKKFFTLQYGAKAHLRYSLIFTLTALLLRLVMIATLTWSIQSSEYYFKVWDRMTNMGDLLFMGSLFVLQFLFLTIFHRRPKEEKAVTVEAE